MASVLAALDSHLSPGHHQQQLLSPAKSPHKTPMPLVEPPLHFILFLVLNSNYVWMKVNGRRGKHCMCVAFICTQIVLVLLLLGIVTSS